MNFKITDQNGVQIIKHLVYPRFTAEITFNNPLSDIENIKMIDQCDNAMHIARAMREAGEFIINYKKNKTQ